MVVPVQTLFPALGVIRRCGKGFRQAAGNLSTRGDNPISCGIHSAGNGAAMRIGPLGTYYYAKFHDSTSDWKTQLIDGVIECSMVTHHDVRGISAAVAIAGACAYLTHHGPVFDRPSFIKTVGTFSKRAEKRMKEISRFRDYL